MIFSFNIFFMLIFFKFHNFFQFEPEVIIIISIKLEIKVILWLIVLTSLLLRN